MKPCVDIFTYKAITLVSQVDNGGYNQRSHLIAASLAGHKNLSHVLVGKLCYAGLESEVKGTS